VTAIPVLGKFRILAHVSFLIGGFTKSYIYTFFDFQFLEKFMDGNVLPIGIPMSIK
jgi:hypothetical protein